MSSRFSRSKPMTPKTAPAVGSGTFGAAGANGTNNNVDYFGLSPASAEIVTGGGGTGSRTALRPTTPGGGEGVAGKEAKAGLRAAMRSWSSSSNLRAAQDSNGAAGAGPGGGGGGAGSGLLTPNGARRGMARDSSAASLRDGAGTGERGARGSGMATPAVLADDGAKVAPGQWVCRSGHVGKLNSTQQAALDELRKTLREEDGFDLKRLGRDSEWQTVALLRFLRARGFGVPQAREMLLKAFAWRDEIGLDALLSGKEGADAKADAGEGKWTADAGDACVWGFKERDQVAKSGWDMFFHSTDRLHRPIFVQRLANLNTTAVFSATTPERIVNYFACTLESACREKYPACTSEARRRHGPAYGPIEDNFMILDVEGLGMTTFWAFKGQLQQLLGTLDANFPELSGRIQIINAPWLFSTIWSYVKAWLPVQTVAKIDIAGADYQRQLLTYIDAENLPTFLGGKCTCAELGGCNRSDVGPWRRTAEQSGVGDVAAKLDGAQLHESEADRLDAKASAAAASGLVGAAAAGAAASSSDSAPSQSASKVNGERDGA